MVLDLLNRGVIAIKNKKQKKTKVSIVKKIMFLLIIVLISIIGIAVDKTYSTIKEVDFEQINKEDLAVNNKIYDEVSNTLSEPEFSEVKTVVFFGVDSRDVADGFSGRSDTIMIASINPKVKGISLISIPRDTYVNIPGYGKDKINHAYAFGKEQLSIKTINQNFGLNVTEYVTIDFSGLINIINEVGGINLEITQEEMKYINERVDESYLISGNTPEKLTKFGSVKLNGEQALTHSRDRTVGDDFVRAGRQRKVLESLITKLSSMDLYSIIKSSDSILKQVKTNINITEYMGSLLSAISNKNKYLTNIVLKQVPAAEYSKGTMLNGTYYFTTNYDSAKKDFVKYIYGK